MKMFISMMTTCTKKNIMGDDAHAEYFNKKYNEMVDEFNRMQQETLNEIVKLNRGHSESINSVPIPIPNINI